jgi:hypothetical protein
MGDRSADAAELADTRSALSLASQVVYQCNVLALLRKLAAQNKGGLVLQLLRDPVKLAARYAEEYERTESGTHPPD